MANRIVLNPISYHGKGAIESIVPEVQSRGFQKAFVCSDPDLIKFGVTAKVTDILDIRCLYRKMFIHKHNYHSQNDEKPSPCVRERRLLPCHCLHAFLSVDYFS